MNRSVRLLVLVAIAAAASGPACRNFTRPSDLGRRLSAGQSQSRELRLRLRGASIRLSSLLEQAADEVAAKSTDSAARRAALMWKIDALPQLHQALFHPDPALALFDAWGLGVQMSSYFTSGAGARALGDQAPRAAAAGASLASEMETVARRVSSHDEDLSRQRRYVERWAGRHPIEGPIASRHSFAETKADDVAEEEPRLLGALGGLEENIDDVRVRLDLSNAFLPKMARWQAELLAQDALAGVSVESALGRLDTLIAQTERAVRAVEEAPGFVSHEREAALDALRGERIAVVKALALEIDKTLAKLTEERMAVTSDLNRQREAAFEALRAERIEITAELEAMVRRLGRDAAEEARGRIEGLLVRAVLLLSIPVAIGTLGFLYVLYRLAKALPAAR